MACPMSMHHLPKLETPPIFTHTSILFLSIPTLLLIFTAILSSRLLRNSPSPKTSTKTHILLTYNLFTSLHHLLLESTFLYNVFSLSIPKLDATYTRGLHSSPFTPSNTHFLSDSKNLYGSFYGNSITARLWQEYAKADKRWGGADLGIIGVELMAVFVLAPLGIYVCYLLRGGKEREAWFWMSVVAMGELYGGWVVLVPESLSGRRNLDLGNWLTGGVYLGLFKVVWMLVPVWVLVGAYSTLTSEALSSDGKMVNAVSEEKQPSRTQSEGKKIEGKGSWVSQQDMSLLRPLVLSE